MPKNNDAQRRETKPLKPKRKAAKKGSKPNSVNKSHILVALSVCLLLFAVFARPSLFPSERELTGEIFITTKGGDNIQMGSVKVYLFPEKEILPRLVENRTFVEYEETYIEAAIKAHKAKEETAEPYTHLKEAQEIIKRGKAYTTGKHWFKFIGSLTPHATAVTNSQGQFTLKAPGRGRFALFAAAERQVQQEVEEYYWLQWIPSGAEKIPPINFNNVSLCTNNSIRQFLIDGLENLSKGK